MFGTVERSVAPSRATFNVDVYPSPFVNTTTLAYDLPADEHVVIRVYDVTGRQVSRPMDEWQQGGAYQVHWDGTSTSGRHLASGVSLFRLQVGATSTMRTVTIAR